MSEKSFVGGEGGWIDKRSCKAPRQGGALNPNGERRDRVYQFQLNEGLP